MDWLAGFAVSMYFLMGILDICKGHWGDAAVDLVGVGMGMAFTAFIERRVNRDADAVACLVMKLPERRRQGLRTYLQCERGG